MEKLKMKKAKESYISLSLLQNSMNSTKAEIEDTEANIEAPVQSTKVILSNFEKLPDNLKLKVTLSFWRNGDKFWIENNWDSESEESL